MLQPEERYMIKELAREGLSISQIARQTGRDRKTVRSTLRQKVILERRPRERRVRKIDPYVPHLEKRIGQGVLNAEKLYQEIKQQGYEGKARTVRTFVQPYRTCRLPVATVRFETEPGEQAQVDWGYFGYIEHQGRVRRLYAFAMTLGWSRTMYVEFTVSMQSVWFLRAHIHAFDYFGGVPNEILHDNLKTAIVGRTSGAIHWNAQYLDFADYYGFTPRVCRPYRAQTKGKVERAIQYIRGNFWPGLEFSTLADLNQQMQSWLATVANVRVHGTTHEVPFQRLPHEHLKPLQPMVYDTSLITSRRSSRDCMVSYQGNRYSVPAAYARQQLQVKETEQGELIIHNLMGEEIARHALAWGRHQQTICAEHYQPLWVQHSNTVQSSWSSGIPLWDAPQVETRPLSIYDEVSQ